MNRLIARDRRMIRPLSGRPGKKQTEEQQVLHDAHNAYNAYNAYNAARSHLDDLEQEDYFCLGYKLAVRWMKEAGEWESEWDSQRINHELVKRAAVEPLFLSLKIEGDTLVHKCIHEKTCTGGRSSIPEENPVVI